MLVNCNWETVSREATKIRSYYKIGVNGVINYCCTIAYDFDDLQLIMDNVFLLNT